SALVTRATGLKESNPPQPVIQSNPSKPINHESNRDSLFCTYCKKHRHTKERCWKLHGKPNRSENNRGQAHVASTQSSNDGSSQSSASEFNNDQIETLKKNLELLEKPSSAGTCSLAFSGISSSSCEQDTKRMIGRA
ncbi:hypothetical protein Pfo_013067, partial [Paulownia fortunei]